MHSLCVALPTNTDTNDTKNINNANNVNTNTDNNSNNTNTNTADTGVCEINARHERKRKPRTSPSTSLQLKQESRRAASHDEIGCLFRTPLHSSSDRVEDRTKEERGRHEEGDA